MDPTGNSPLLVLDRARILVDGAVGAPLAARGGSERVAIVGDLRPFFRLLARDATLAAGEASLASVPAERAVPSGAAGLALRDPPLPPEWTAERYLLESARLAGLGERDARREVESAIARFELAAMARRRFQDLFIGIRRVVLLAHATLGSPRVLVAETPLAELDPGSQAYLDVALERAAQGRKLVCSVAALVSPAERALAERADWVVVALAGSVVREGPPRLVLTTEGRYAATVTRSAEAFLRALAERGVSAARTEISPALLGFVPTDPAGICRVVIELSGDRSAADVVHAAHAAGAPLVELRPL